jgi:spore coat polysaccharide biosynthesis predicted glycosyltransferase SpsG
MKKFSILIRLDADAKTGLGHLSRSIAIAGFLKNEQTEPIFLTNGDNYAKELIKNKGFQHLGCNAQMNEEEKLLYTADKIKPALIFIDKLYPYTKDFILKLKQISKTVIFHTNCEGNLFADAFILPSAHSDEHIIRNHLKHGKNKFYYGPDYVVISEKAKSMARVRSTTKIRKNKICISTGGSDPEGLMTKILPAINKLKLNDYEIKALIGNNFMHREALNKIIPKLQSSIQCVAFDINEFTDTGCALATFGVLTYELIHAGIPILSVAHAEANARGSKNAEMRYRCLKDIGLFKNMTQKEFISEFETFIHDTDLQKQISQNTKQLIDGKGAERTAKILTELSEK